MDTRSIMINEIIANTPKGMVPLPTKKGVAIATKTKRVEYTIMVKNIPSDKAKKVGKFLSRLLVFVDDKVVKKPTHILTKVVVYDRAIGIKIYNNTTSRKTEIGEVIFDGNSMGMRVYFIKELGNPEFVRLGINIVKDFANTIGIKV